jgi:hypothetical protein
MEGRDSDGSDDSDDDEDDPDLARPGVERTDEVPPLTQPTEGRRGPAKNVSSNASTDAQKARARASVESRWGKEAVDRVFRPQLDNPLAPTGHMFWRRLVTLSIRHTLDKTQKLLNAAVLERVLNRGGRINRSPSTALQPVDLKMVIENRVEDVDPDFTDTGYEIGRDGWLRIEGHSDPVGADEAETDEANVESTRDNGDAGEDGM